jgi:TPP-dependent pyruvate/acetoin dehydrogenase alpha subunit
MNETSAGETQRQGTPRCATRPDNPSATLLTLYPVLLRARIFEERMLPLASGLFHAGAGQEAIGTAVCTQLASADYLLYSHRGTTQLIAKGVPPVDLFADFLGRAGGPSRGRGAGIIHVADPSRGVLGQSGTLGGAFPLACGAGFSARAAGEGRIVACFFGEGTTARGTFHEAMNWAALERLPILFVCENNRWAISLSVERGIAGSIARRAESYGLPVWIVDGQDLLAVYDTAGAALAHVRSGSGPALIEAKTMRLRGHHEGDVQSYRPPGEVEAWTARDPIALAEARMLALGAATRERLDEIRRDVAAEIDAALAAAQAMPKPLPSVAFEDIYTP